MFAMPHSVDVDRASGTHKMRPLWLSSHRVTGQTAGTGSMGGSPQRPFFRALNRQGALADGLYGLNPRNTTGERITLLDRGSLSERDCRKLGPRGESNAQPIESLPLGALGGVLMVAHGSTRLNARFRNGQHSESVRWGTFKASLGEGRSPGITLARTMEKTG
jgi:hypothetical protein